MSKSALFRKIVARSVLVGLQAGAALGFIAGFFLMISIGFWAVAIGLGYGCVLGAVLGLINGLLLAWLICRFFFPYTYTQRGALRRATQTGSIAVSLLEAVVMPASIAAASGVDPSSVGVFLAITTPLIGTVAWWASWRVNVWYEALSKLDAVAAD